MFPKFQNNKKGKGNKFQGTKGWTGTGSINEGTLKGVIINNGTENAPQFIYVLQKIALYRGGLNYQYLPEVIEFLEDKPSDHEDFNEPDSDTMQWEEERMVPMLHGNGSTIVVNDVVQMEKKMISNKSKEKVGIAKRSKKFHDACVQGGFTCTFGCGIQTHAQAICPGFIMVRTDYATGTVQNCTHSVAGMYFNRLFLQHKQAVLQVILSNVHLAVVQQVKSIMEYKQIENNKDLIGTLHILKDICFEDRNGGLTFPQMTFLEQ